MFHHLAAAKITKSAGGTRTFEGGPYNAGVSFFLVEEAPGAGPALHRHEYPETFIIESGAARFTVDDAQLNAGPGDIVVVEAGTPHGFVSSGPDTLVMTCIHTAPAIRSEWLDGRTSAPSA